MKWLDKVKAFFNYEENVEAYCFTLVGVFLFGAVMLGIWGAKWHEKNTKNVFGYEYSAETVVYDKSLHRPQRQLQQPRSRGENWKGGC